MQPDSLNSSSSQYTVNLSAVRAQKARLRARLGKASFNVVQSGMIVSLLLTPVIIISGTRPQAAWLSAALGLACFMLSQWYKHDLATLPPGPHSLDLTNRLSGEVLERLTPDLAHGGLSPQIVWHVLTNHWQAYFLMNRLLMVAKHLEPAISDRPADMQAVWQAADHLAEKAGSHKIEPGHVFAAMLLTEPNLKPEFDRMKYSHDDIMQVIQWLDRVVDVQNNEPPFFGGIGRDWASGFTPTLNRFGHNISIDIEHSGGQFDALTASAGVAALQNSFSQGASGVALIGPDGIGKTSHVYALAQLMLEGKVAPILQYHQIIGLNPSVIISSARHPGELEEIVLTLLSEALHAGHIILFLDDAQLFFSNGPGSLDLTRILLPIMQSGRIRIIMAMDPSDYQRLRAYNAAFANQMTPVTLVERSKEDVLDVLEDVAVGLEHKHNALVSYDALREAYRLSGRYETETAYPGRAIQLLERAMSHSIEGRLITAVSVQKAIEQARGVKVGAAAPLEADALLHLEDTIHQRMINQTRAVKVVAAALRRARAGVSSPNRPIGSFLFLGPTGVGKTELAKAIAATYFNDEANMIRLDMSEYQRPEDVTRLLSDGKEESNSLILAVRRQPFTVVLLDEIEKAHPNILNLLLQMLDEGSLTDNGGRQASFKDCIVICTSNAGADAIRERIERGEELASFEREFTDQLINSGQFRPELLNRFDEIVLFRPLKPEELAQVVRLMIGGINKTLAAQNISVELTDAAVMKIVETGNDPRLGARPMRRMLQRAVEDGIAGRILRGEARPGDRITLDVGDLAL